MTEPRESVLFVTIDSCRFDTFEAAAAPNLKAIGPLHRTHAPSHFTFASHSAMFVGFTPGDAAAREPFVNPKYGRIFRLAGGGRVGPGGAGFLLGGETIVQGFKRGGYRTIGSGACRWFNTGVETGALLRRHFDRFLYPGDTRSLRRQVAFLTRELDARRNGPSFVFLNVGETHIPYYHDGAPWAPDDNPIEPFGDENDADLCRTRQRACLEFVDRELAPLLDRFADASVVVCSDHGDCWGEDGLWGHGFHHEAVLTVPLLFRIALEDTVDLRGTRMRRRLRALRKRL
jgi:hypothetical protein